VKKRVAVLVCNQGLGHLRRVIGLLDQLDRTSPGLLDADIYVDQGKFALLRIGKDRQARWRFHDLKADVLHYEEELLALYPGALEECDCVWSDNLLFPMKYREEVFFTGSFLWCELFPRVEVMRREADLFDKVQPVVFGNRYFATPKVQSSSQYTGVGLYDFTGDGSPYLAGFRILLSCGGTGPARTMIKKGLTFLRQWIRELPDQAEVFVEPDFFDDLDDRVRVRRATFSPEMFDVISAAVIRPGMGTVSDCLTRGTRIFAFWEDGHFEMKHNAQVLEQLGLGEGCGSLEQATKAATAYLWGLEGTERWRSRELDFQGLEQTCRKIQEILNAQKPKEISMEGARGDSGPGRVQRDSGKEHSPAFG